VSSPPKKSPDLVSVTTINSDGSRHFLQPSHVHGRFTTWRRIFGLLLVAIYVALPWIKINGYPAVFLDIATRRFHLFGLTLAAQDLWVLFFLIAGLGLTLFVVTALFGRLWCGWACPYTVFIDNFYRPIEAWLEGDGPDRRKLDDAPWTADKIMRRAAKWFLFLLIAAAIAHVFLSYFVSLPKLWGMMRGSPLDNAKSFGVIAVLTIVLYFCFTWFREQFCIIMCPYGRLQSALTDDDTVIIGYDKIRGEPRGKASDPNAGDCIDCRRCVNVCPTGIDIRHGLQLECIGCSYCIDACDEIMENLGRPRGLVRYDSMNRLAGRAGRIVRPRLFLYAAMVVIGAALFGITAAKNARPITAQITRTRGKPYLVNEQAILNRWKLTLINKRNQPTTFTVSLEGAPEGLRMSGIDGPVEFAAGREDVLSVVFLWDRARYSGPAEFEVLIHGEPGNAEVRQTVRFLGPNPQLLEAE
jgi:cytochrome c oxidase accessory protein FixG